tara:strand:- start:278 stop:766 length:489 start_codon:yes stop_codon:yes gene_type:complete
MISADKMKFLFLASLTTLMVINTGCSNKKSEKDAEALQQKLPLEKFRSMQNRDATGVARPLTKIKGFDPCDCNKKSQSIMDKTILIRKKFESISELKSDVKAKQEIRKFATEYNQLVAKCFEANAARLFEPSECNDLKALEDKKELLYSLGIQIDLGANIKL